MGYRRETRELVEETINKLALNLLEDIEYNGMAEADKTNALANLIRANAEAMGESGNVEKKIADLREELKRYGINLN